MVLDCKKICKSFGANKVLHDVDFSVSEGEICALVGENGAGKSTLVKVIAGVHNADSGSIQIDGKHVAIKDVADARAHGICEIYQELMLIPNLSIAENVFLGNEITVNGLQLNFRQMEEKTTEVLRQLGMDLSPRLLIKQLSTAQQQMVEIAKALVLDKKLIILDEPTDSLSPKNTDDLFNVLLSLKKRGVSMIYISHRLEELSRICDRIVVLRDGVVTGTKAIAEVTIDEIVRMMIGRDVKSSKKSYTIKQAPTPLLQVRDVSSSASGVSGASFVLYPGEIIGFAGLVGAGRTELMRLIFGADPKEKGEIFVKGKKVSIKQPADAVACRIGFLTESRREQGLALNLSVGENISLGNIDEFVSKGRIDFKKEAQAVNGLVAQLQIKPADPRVAAAHLSGGNQQKVLLARWLLKKCSILIIDEPTRGIDVGAKSEIYRLMQELVTSTDAGIIMVSSEMPEVLRLSDRIYVMAEGRITAEFTADEASEEKIMERMLPAVKA